MITRELLRAAADRIDCGAGTESAEGCDMKPPCSEYAAALRAIADRFDAEFLNASKPAADVPARVYQACLVDILARLDAPVTK